MPSFEIETPEGIRLRTEIAGVGSRLAAALLDSILIVAGYLALLLLLWLLSLAFGELGVSIVESISSFVFGLMTGGLLIAFPVYFTFFHLAWNGQTLGKRSVGIRVVSSHGEPASGLQYFVRSLLWLVEAVLWVPVPLGLILIAVMPRGRRLGDLAAGTMVLCESTRTEVDEPWPTETWREREPKVLDLSVGMASRLDEEDLAFLRDAICRRGLPRPVRKRLYGKIVAHYADQLGFTPDQNVRTSLKELYLFGRESRE